MIEKIVIDYLSERQDVPVYGEVPENKPQRFIVVDKIDSGRRNHIKTASIRVRSYEESMFKAAVLDDAVKDILLGDDESIGIIEIDDVTKAEDAGSSNDMDTQTKSYRYTSIYNFFYY